MKHYLIQQFLLAVFFLTSLCQVSFAQQAAKAEDVVGKINGRSADGTSWHFEMLNHLYKNKPYYPQMKKTVMDAFYIAIRASVVNPLNGLNVAPSLVAYHKNKLSPASNVFSGDMNLMCFNFTKNKNGKPGFHEEEESHGGLNIRINDLSECYNNQFTNQFSEAGIPDFFFLPALKKMSGTKLRMGKNTIVLKKNIPVFTPITNREYLQMMIIKCQYDIKNENYEVSVLKKFLKKYKAALKVMPVTRQKSMAYVAYDFKNPYPEYYYQLVSKNTKEAKALYRVNPNYYDKTVPKTAPQVIVISWHASGFCPAYEKQVLEKWFSQIDYGRLQAMIR